MRIPIVVLLGVTCLVKQESGPSMTVPKGQILGRVLFRGKRPPSPPFEVPPERIRGGDPETVPNETILINDNETLQNVLVWVKAGAPKVESNLVADPALIEIHDCRFRPHVVAIRVGQPLILKGTDGRNYCVEVAATLNKPWSVTLNKGGQDRTAFTTSEIGIPIKAIRPWMSGTVHVLAHPYFAVTGERGAFEIKGLPPGDYEVEAWHEKLGRRSALIKLDDKAGQKTDFDFTPPEEK